LRRVLVEEACVDGLLRRVEGLLNDDLTLLVLDLDGVEETVPVELGLLLLTDLLTDALAVLREGGLDGLVGRGESDVALLQDVLRAEEAADARGAQRSWREVELGDLVAGTDVDHTELAAVDLLGLGRLRLVTVSLRELDELLGLVDDGLQLQRGTTHEDRG